MHVLGDPADLQAALAAKINEPGRASSSSSQEGRVEALEARVAELEQRLAQLEAALNA